MHRRTNTPFRLLRTGLLGATAFGLAAGAHMLAGGTLPGPGIMTALLSLHVLCFTAATAIHLGLPAMTVLLGASQLVLHKAFDVLSAVVPAVPMAPGMGHPMSMAGQSAAMVHAAGARGAGVDSMIQADAMSGWMVPAHIAATLLTAVLLAQGESALWALASWLRPLCGPAAVVRPLTARQAIPKVLPAPLPRLPWRNLRPDTRRGPPPLAVVFA
ncbi:hypothetical protein [Arthrobacter dokdonensis]|uniref:hypothetical protein n=1 Tax=Arthrobacter dokdonellae TaxID=2211210 RepID=UPI000DE5AC99|nr:hypothetical protein [Arthrobacter dokdonellae]